MQVNKILLFIVSVLLVVDIAMAASRSSSPDPDMQEALRQSLEEHQKDNAARAKEDADLAAAMAASRLDAGSPVGASGGAGRSRSKSPHRGPADRLDFDHLTTGDVHMKGRRMPVINVDVTRPAIRKSLTEYEREYKTHKLVLGAGHKPHGYGGEPPRFSDYYAVDLLVDGECDPDAVLDIGDEHMMAYFPSNWADEVYVDEDRIFIGDQFGMPGPRGIGVGMINEKSIANVIRILKPGAKWILPTKGNWTEALERLKKLGASDVITARMATLEHPGREEEVFVITK